MTSWPTVRCCLFFDWVRGFRSPHSERYHNFAFLQFSAENAMTWNTPDITTNNVWTQLFTHKVPNDVTKRKTSKNWIPDVSFVLHANFRNGVRKFFGWTRNAFWTKPRAFLVSPMHNKHNGKEKMNKCEFFWIRWNHSNLQVFGAWKTSSSRFCGVFEKLIWHKETVFRMFSTCPN